MYEWLCFATCIDPIRIFYYTFSKKKKKMSSIFRTLKLIKIDSVPIEQITLR